MLLSTYTTGKIAKIPLNVDATLVSDGTAPRSIPRRSRRQVRHRQERAIGDAGAGQGRVAVERRRGHPAGRQHAATHRQAAGQRAAAGAGRHRGGQPQDRDGGLQREQPRRSRAEAPRHRGREPADQHRAAPRGTDLPVPVRHREEDVPDVRPDRAEGVRRELRRRGRRQRADHLPVHPERRLRRRRQARRAGQVRVAVRRRRRQPGTARASLWGLPGTRTNRSP